MEDRHLTKPLSDNRQYRVGRLEIDDLDNLFLAEGLRDLQGMKQVEAIEQARSRFGQLLIEGGAIAVAVAIPAAHHPRPLRAAVIEFPQDHPDEWLTYAHPEAPSELVEHLEDFATLGIGFDATVSQPRLRDMTAEGLRDYFSQEYNS